MRTLFLKCFPFDASWYFWESDTASKQVDNFHIKRVLSRARSRLATFKTEGSCGLPRWERAPLGLQASAPGPAFRLRGEALVGLRLPAPGPRFGLSLGHQTEGLATAPGLGPGPQRQGPGVPTSRADRVEPKPGRTTTNWNKTSPTSSDKARSCVHTKNVHTLQKFDGTKIHCTTKFAGTRCGLRVMSILLRHLETKPLGARRRMKRTS